MTHLSGEAIRIVFETRRLLAGWSYSKGSNSRSFCVFHASTIPAEPPTREWGRRPRTRIFRHSTSTWARQHSLDIAPGPNIKFKNKTIERRFERGSSRLFPQGRRSRGREPGREAQEGDRSRIMVVG